eukprot:CAMPEP_0174847892 /NCGR_PEP_ID=MMETSP1114-20130205/13195_1 /TAXON_ID=312471 /ORGANISM="Neobodo designis, Strain CCAP 1951/1" /LENGTH=59 /DNA_ID=CAMNT_0016082181 /DNA_START=18 /DNA_END=194 /DNA_ORIENTATION=+
MGMYNASATDVAFRVAKPGERGHWTQPTDNFTSLSCNGNEYGIDLCATSQGTKCGHDTD